MAARASPPTSSTACATATARCSTSCKGASLGQVVAAPYVAAMNDMMNATLVSGTGRQAALPNQIAGGKTGTSQSSRDAWFVGYTALLRRRRLGRQ